LNGDIVVDQHQIQFIDIWQPKGWITQAHNHSHCNHCLNKNKRVIKMISLCENTQQLVVRLKMAYDRLVLFSR